MADDKNPQLPLDGGTPPGGGTNFLPMNIEEEMRRSYLAYSMSVIVGRALPDARDGLKPVHRRILTAMDREGLQHNKRYSKCAGVVGECLKKYHPTAIRRSTTPWCAWPSPSRCVIPWSMARATSAPSMATRPQLTDTPSAAWSASPKK